MLIKILFFVAVNTASVYLVSQLLENFVVTGGTLGFVLVGVIIGLLNLFLKPLLKVLSLPFIFLTAGLFMIVINGIVLWLAELVLDILDIAGIQLLISGVGTYLASVFLLGVLNYFFQKIS